MPFETMRTFFALAALAVNIATIALLIIGLIGRKKDHSPFAFLEGTTMWLAGGIALASTLGSLYLSEIVHLIPCKFCWYQRIAMYPIALILLLAAARKDAKARLYAVSLAVIGAGIAGWHRLIQSYPSLESGSCAATGPPCSAPYIKEFGFVTIPYMALSAFLLIIVLMWADRLNGDSARSIPPSDQA
ncbi:MAG: disulfide oxidoreductase [Actinomycetia bacterium]|nr:disulfide oxidoreductase [Actinomycetes bacterium]